MKIRTLVSILIILLAVLVLCEVKATASDEEDFFSAAMNGDVAGIKRLLKKGVDINTFQDQRMTALLLAISNGKIHVAEFLIEAGADVNLKDNRGCTALGFASATGQTQVVKMLIDAGADVNAQDDQGRTALMLASAAGSIEIVRLLIDAGANIRTRDNMGRDAYMVATYFTHTEIAKLLTPEGFTYVSDQTIVHHHSGAVFEETCDIFIRSGVTRYDALGKDVSVGYDFRGESGSIFATIYVYPTNAGEVNDVLLRNHFQELKNTVLNYYSNVQLTAEQENRYEFPTGDRFGIWAGFNLVVNNEHKRSFLFLFGENEWFISYRITYPAIMHGKEGVSDAITNLVSSFDYSAIH
jgi:hypothetical protein